MFAYELESPIDFWEGWLTEAEYLEHLIKGGPFSGDYKWSQIGEYFRLRIKAEEIACTIGWEGDTRQGPFITALPPDDIIVAWKHDNNGDTFVFSPRPLPWLAVNREAAAAA